MDGTCGPISMFDWSLKTIDRAGVIPVYDDGIYKWIGLGVTRLSGSLVLIGGAFENKDHDLLDTAVREFNEEVNPIKNLNFKRNLSTLDVLKCHGAWVDGSDFSSFHRGLYIFFPIYRKPLHFQPTPELYDILWVTPTQLINLIKFQTITPFKRNSVDFSFVKCTRSKSLITIANYIQKTDQIFEINPLKIWPAPISRIFTRRAKEKFTPATGMTYDWQAPVLSRYMMVVVFNSKSQMATIMTPLQNIHIFDLSQPEQLKAFKTLFQKPNLNRKNIIWDPSLRYELKYRYNITIKNCISIMGELQSFPKLKPFFIEDFTRISVEYTGLNRLQLEASLILKFEKYLYYLKNNSIKENWTLTSLTNIISNLVRVYKLKYDELVEYANSLIVPGGAWFVEPHAPLNQNIIDHLLFKGLLIQNDSDYIRLP